MSISYRNVFAELYKQLNAILNNTHISNQSYNIAEEEICDSYCVNLAKQYTFDTSRKFRRTRHNINMNNVNRGLKLMATNSIYQDTRFQNKAVVAKRKKTTTARKQHNSELQIACRASFRAMYPDKKYDFNRWDIIPQSVYNIGFKHKPNLNNPIVQWVVDEKMP